MSATLIDGGPAGPDEVGGQYRNRILTDRVAWWRALGARQGVLEGFTTSTVAGIMALDFASGIAAVEERDSLGNVGTGRGYVVWSEDVTQVTFAPASAADRKDAVVLAFCDLAAGAGAFGTETSIVGGQLVVVSGVSGTTTPRTDSQIQDAVGSGGWIRVADILIPAGSTEISAGNITAGSEGVAGGWRTVTFVNGWGTTQFFRVKVDAANNLHIQGRLDVLGASGSTVCTLPDGFRPVLPAGQFLKVPVSPQTTADAAKANITDTGNFAVFYSGTPTYISVNVVIAMG